MEFLLKLLTSQLPFNIPSYKKQGIKVKTSNGSSVIKVINQHCLFQLIKNIQTKRRLKIHFIQVLIKHSSHPQEQQNLDQCVKDSNPHSTDTRQPAERERKNVRLTVLGSNKQSLKN